MPRGIPHSRFLAWSELDQDKALAWVRAQREVCSGCGTRQAEWDANPVAYVGDVQICPGCEVIEQERENVAEGTKGVRFGLVPHWYALEQAESLGNAVRPASAPGLVDASGVPPRSTQEPGLM